ncbi:HD-GYP domain-containing protein [Sedimentibacter sp. zth1]|uniref:HD-GYP domain-containing protein n=1 Tax=Sedimentibacter sp. zth1 TaxID=2816908 RepID=UPI001A910036|nr:HD-GYP domain-containing protein [Sedimentibacter sp. zth1]QSX05130.1 HD-GYP domain-containing protein [Sedimentibacter sp. zth1]
MLFIPTELLKPNMIIARDINLTITDQFSLPLLRKGQVLNDLFIKKIKFHNIAGVYIDNDIAKDIIVNDIISEKLKITVLRDIKKNFNLFKKNRGEVNTHIVDNISKIAKSLVLDILSNDEILINLIDLKNYDDYTYRHSLCVAILSITTGISLQLNEHMLTEIGICALLHDIGKMTIPIEIINKPDLLSPQEYDTVKQHPIIAVEKLKKLSFVSQAVLDGILTHHEKFDGTGYPYGLKGDEIPLYGKILAIADVYDALTSTRSYRRACFPNEAIEYVMGCADVHFDYNILKAFLKNIAAYPVGTFVSLSNGQIAIVVKNLQVNPLRPIIRIIYADGTTSKNINLSYDLDHMNITIVSMGYENPGFSYSQ